MEKQISLLVDWQPTFLAVKRRRRPGAAPWAQDLAQIVLDELAAFFVANLPKEHQWVVEATAFGGFRDGGGVRTPEAEQLFAALRAKPWIYRIDHVIFRGLELVDYLSPTDSTSSLSGLYRDDEPIRRAHISQAASACQCKWLIDTKKWLSDEIGGDRICPTCATAPPGAAVLAQPQQKLVDALLISRALAKGKDIAIGGRNQLEQVWMCSSDADVVPALAMLAHWNIDSTWLQPSKNESFNYAQRLRSLGVAVRVMG